ncbi:MAG: hypothetical protein CM15mV27_1410 [Caudoviricetes sp.]|nr:MAG: hypothetical protein CM15mV27_1410 [Caudoviricetes sp.]
MQQSKGSGNVNIVITVHGFGLYKCLCYNNSVIITPVSTTINSASQITAKAVTSQIFLIHDLY